jgi:competence protein ComEC
MTGHHGSDTSISQNWLDEVTPQNVIISVGDNSYGHPSDKTLSLLNENQITTYRTDDNGTITATSTGKKITFTSEDGIKKATLTSNMSTPTPIPNPTATPTPTIVIDNNIQDNKETVVFITKSGEKYHVDGCSYLSKSKISINLKEAKAKGYEPCGRCNPPE